MSVYSEHPALFITVTTLIGGVIGSFLNVCIYRMPKNLSIVRPRSTCPKCHTAIPFYLNVPVLSYVFLRGKCATCKNPISAQYPIVELLAAAFTLFFAWKLGPSGLFIKHMVFVYALIVLSFIDLEYKIIPDIISLGGIPVGILLTLLIRDIPWYESIIGAAVGFGFFFAIAYLYLIIRKREGLGGGDIKLIGMFGAFWGFRCILPTIIVGSMLGSLIGVFLMFARKKDSTFEIPFGPFLSIGILTFLIVRLLIQPS